MLRRIRRFGQAKHTAPGQPLHVRQSTLGKSHRSDRCLDAPVTRHALANTRHPAQHRNRPIGENLSERKCFASIQSGHTRGVRHDRIDRFGLDPGIIQRSRDGVAQAEIRRFYDRPNWTQRVNPVRGMRRAKACEPRDWLCVSRPSGILAFDDEDSATLSHELPG